jgi:hypothetical protein
MDIKAQNYLLCRSRLEANTDCLLWERRRGKSGYGLAVWKGKKWTAHRLAYTAFIDPIPEGMCVLHRCDNPPCINWKHLWLGTRADNNLDMVKKGRSLKGDKHFRFGKPLPVEIRLKIGRANRGRSVPIEARLKISQSRLGELHPLFGKEHSLKTRQKMQESQRRRRAETSVSSETKERMRQSQQRRREMERKNLSPQLKFPS